MRVFVPLLLMLAAPAFAQGSGPTPALANRQLPDPAKEAEATRLMHSLRCIQCQGQSIADSDASMAATMRAEVRQQILAMMSRFMLQVQDVIFLMSHIQVISIIRVILLILVTIRQQYLSIQMAMKQEGITTGR